MPDNTLLRLGPVFRPQIQIKGALLRGVSPQRDGIFSRVAAIAAASSVSAVALVVGTAARSASISLASAISVSAMAAAISARSVALGGQSAVAASAQRIAKASASVAASSVVTGVLPGANIQSRSATISAQSTLSGSSVLVATRSATVSAQTLAAGVASATETADASLSAQGALSGVASTIASRSGAIAGAGVVSGVAGGTVAQSASIAASATVTAVGEDAASGGASAEAYLQSHIDTLGGEWFDLKDAASISIERDGTGGSPAPAEFVGRILNRRTGSSDYLEAHTDAGRAVMGPNSDRMITPSDENLSGASGYRWLNTEDKTGLTGGIYVVMKTDDDSFVMLAHDYDFNPWHGVAMDWTSSNVLTSGGGSSSFYVDDVQYLTRDAGSSLIVGQGDVIWQSQWGGKGVFDQGVGMFFRYGPNDPIRTALQGEVLGIYWPDSGVAESSDINHAGVMDALRTYYGLQ